MFSLLDLALIERGYVRSHDRRIDALRDDARTSFTLRLEAYRSYKFFGLCNEDCSDLDLVPLSPSGLPLRSDTERDAFPTFEYRPTRGGTYKVQAHMFACTTEPCFFGISIYTD